VKRVQLWAEHIGEKWHAIGNIFENTFNTLQEALRTFWEHIGNNKAPKQSNSPHPLSQKGRGKKKKKNPRLLQCMAALPHCLGKISISTFVCQSFRSRLMGGILQLRRLSIFINRFDMLDIPTTN
jgi:hypothetical protein